MVMRSVKVKGPELAAAGAELISSILKSDCDFSERTIYLNDIIDMDMAYRFKVTLEKLDRSAGDIKVVLMSAGGEEPAGWMIYDCIREARNVVKIDGYGSVWSMAALILQAGSIRRMARSCRYMLHAGSMKLGNNDQRNVMSAGIECQIQNRRYIQAIAARAGRTFKEVWRLWNKEAYLSADKALEMGFIDAVIPYNEGPFKKKGKGKKK